MNKIKVFCLPYAGGSKSIFNDWIDEYKDIAMIIPMEYSGHGSRFSEELYTDANKMAEDIFMNIVSQKPVDYIIYGHSMGCLIALLTSLKLEERYFFPPKKVIIGGTRPPHLNDKDERISDLPQKEFMDKFFEMGMMDPEIKDEPELVDLLYDIFHADSLIGEKYNEFDNLPKLKTSMVVMTGTQDEEALKEDMMEWKNYTDGSFKYKEFDAGHFFPFNCPNFHEFFSKCISE